MTVAEIPFEACQIHGSEEARMRGPIMQLKGGMGMGRITVERPVKVAVLIPCYNEVSE